MEFQMNKIRSELETQGGNYGQRLDYTATLINGYKYIPFDKGAKDQTSLGLSALLINRYIKSK